jgi:DNA modification methylase
MAKVDTHQNQMGRFPANLLVSDDVLNDGVFRHKAGNVRVSNMGDYDASSYKAGDYPHNPNYYSDDDGDSFSRYFNLDAWFDTKFLPKEAQKTFPFMIVPKASKSEKGKDNKHPTVKPVKLFSWLMTIGSREGDLVLDPFLGSGTTLEACRKTNRNCIGFEISDEWEKYYPDRAMSYTPTLQSYMQTGDE